MDIKVTFAFLAIGAIGIFAGGSVLMGLVSVIAKPISPDASASAGGFSGIFLLAAIGLAVLFLYAKMRGGE